MRRVTELLLQVCKSAATIWSWIAVASVFIMSLGIVLAADIKDFFTTRTVVLRIGKKTTESRQLLTTDAPVFLDQVVTDLPEPNASLVRLMLLYPRDGSHKYWWPKKKEQQYDGSTTNILLQGRKVMNGEPQGRTFCCGLTLEVFYRFAAEKPAFADLLATTDTARVKSLWFCRNLFSPGPQDALLALDAGRRIGDPEEALPGDFVQIWRNDKSGHSVMFVNWLRDATGKRVGLQYWSSQIATQGIGFNSESFGDEKKQIVEKYLSITRPKVNN